jgi:hypothetical protein
MDLRLACFGGRFDRRRKFRECLTGTSGPLVFAYVGSREIECPSPQTQEFWHALHDLGIPTSYAIYPGEGHRMIDPAHIADVQDRALAWFDRYLR